MNREQIEQLLGKSLEELRGLPAAELARMVLDAVRARDERKADNLRPHSTTPPPSPLLTPEDIADQDKKHSEHRQKMLNKLRNKDK